MFQSERELFPPKQSARMADGEDLSVLKRRIVAVDKLVRSQQKVESRNAEILLSLEAKEKELEEAKIAKEELEKRKDEIRNQDLYFSVEKIRYLRRRKKRWCQNVTNAC